MIVLLACGCGATTAASKPLALATPVTHARTIADRKAVACSREHLVALEPSWVAKPEAPQAPNMVVRRVSVLDGAGKIIDVTSDVLTPIRVGHVFSPEDAREAARRLWKTGKFDDIAIETEQGAVIFRVVERRTIAEVFTNNPETESIHIVTGAVYNPVAIVSAGIAYAESEVRRGYPDAQLALSSDFADDAHRTIDVCIRFDAGSKVTLDAIDIRGSAHDAALAALVAREDTRNVRGNVLDLEMLERDELVMAAWLYDQGLLTHKIERAIERNSDVFTVILHVTDGPAYRYSSVDLQGDLLAPKAEYGRVVTEKRGDVFNRTAMLKTIDDIKALHVSLGRADIEVEPSVDLDAAKNTVAVVIKVHDAHKAPTRP